ncbi:hypothetical protein, partial [Legionella norrlandica]|uniref:hypothetical protein n=1 Tax=Legionella norrlandica TaxID=1498499 RepID=UPI0019D327EC
LQQEYAFCKNNNIMLNSFLYRWHEKKKSLKSDNKKAVSSRKTNRIASFEPVVLTEPSPCSLLENSLVELSLHFPNQIR